MAESQPVLTRSDDSSLIAGVLMDLLGREAQGKPGHPGVHPDLLASIRHLLLDSSKFRVVDMMCHLVKTEEQLEELVHFLDGLQLLLPYLRFSLVREVRQTSHAANLFRASSPGVRLASCAMRLSGQPLQLKIGAAFSAFARRYMASASEWKYRRARTPRARAPGPQEHSGDPVAISLQFLLMLLEKYRAREDVVRFTPILALVGECVCCKFPDMKLEAIGAFLFLRWLTPCLTALQFSSSEVNVLQNVLIVSKVLQKLANNTLFDEGHHLHGTNSIISDNMALRTQVLLSYSKRGRVQAILADEAIPVRPMFLANMSAAVCHRLTQCGMLSVVPRVTDVFLKIQVARAATDADMLDLPQMKTKRRKSDALLSEGRAAKLRIVAENAPRETLFSLVKDQAAIIERQERKIRWLEEALGEAREACSFIRDHYVMQLKQQDRRMLEVALAKRDGDGPTQLTEADGSVPRRRLRRSLSMQHLSGTHTTTEWDQSTVNRQMLRIASSLSDVDGMQHTRLLLLRCPRCQQPCASRASLIQHYRETCKSILDSPASANQCPRCLRNIIANDRTFKLHVSSCNPETSPEEKSSPNNGHRLSHSTTTKTLGNSFWNRLKPLTRSMSKRRHSATFTEEPAETFDDSHISHLM